MGKIEDSKANRLNSLLGVPSEIVDCRKAKDTLLGTLASQIANLREPEEPTMSEEEFQQFAKRFKKMLHDQVEKNKAAGVKYII